MSEHSDHPRAKPSPAEPAPERFTPGLSHAFSFAAFNALSFQLVLGSPMVLYAKHLGASATVLGIIAGMMPLLVIFQIPAANYVDRVGYKRFVYAGWGIRVGFIFVLSLIPLTSPFLDATSRLSLVLLLLFAFNLSRGISSCAWLPWITSLVPASLRGKFLAREAAFVNGGSFLTLLVAALCLRHDSSGLRFFIIFFFSGIMGAVSLYFLRRIPDVPTPAATRYSKTPVPYGEIARYDPFRKLLASVMVWSLAYGGITTFTVAFLKAGSAMTESQILLVAAVAFLGGLSSLWFLGSRLDRVGSKPILSLSLIAWIIIMIGWFGLAAGLLSPRVELILSLQFLMGLAAALVNMAHTRLAMAIIPAMGRNHFFAVYSVIANVTLGLAPILWGLVIDFMAPFQLVWQEISFNRFSLFFAMVGSVFAIALFAVQRLDEPDAASMEQLLRELLIQSPQRVWVRLWPRI
jgi:MFS family permease